MSVAVVTGAGRGIGRAIARRLQADGRKVIAIDKQEGDGVDEVCDVSDAAAVKAVADRIGPIDVLVNNAGIWLFSSLLDMPPEDALTVLQVNLLGPVYCSQAFVPGMAANGGGAIVNISSVAAATRSPGVGMYPASKAAVETLTRQMAMEFGPMGIRVNAIGPGLIVTEGTAHNYEGGRGEERAQSVPIRRTGTPEDIADVAGFLVSDQSRYVTGQVIYVDGGVTASH